MLTQIVGWILGSAFAAEFLGYLLHRLPHTGWIPWLSASHMKHHMVLYGPLKKQRPSAHGMHATPGRPALGNMGGEWLLPTALLLAGVSVLFALLQFEIFHRILFLSTVLTWSFVMFGYLHDRMHIKNFWMERDPVLKGWFRRARQLHDIHHRVFNDQGLMNKNFGIGFYLFDRLFGTLCREQGPFNHRGYAQAKESFSYLEAP